MSAVQDAFTNSHITLAMGAAGIVEGCLTATTPHGTLTIPKTKAWNGQGKPDNCQTISSVDWSPITVTRLHTQDAFKKLWAAWKKGVDKPKEAKENYTMTEICGDQTLATWNLKGCYIKEVKTTDHDANGHEIKKITFIIEYDDAECT